jgi:Tfp pilus assembly protein PilX
VKVLMFTVTEPLAVSLFNWSNVLLALGTVLVLIGIIGIFAMGAAKERFSSERISSNEAETDRAKAALEEYKKTVDEKVADAKQEGIKAGQTAANAQAKAQDLEQQAMPRWRKLLQPESFINFWERTANRCRNYIQ